MINPPPIEVANVSMADSLILMVMALVVFGPRRLPQIARQLGKLMYEFRKASNDFKFQMEEELRSAEEADRRKKEEEERQRNLAANPPAQLEASTATEAATTETSDPYSSYSSYNEAAEAELGAEPAPVVQPPSTGETVEATSPAGREPESSSVEASEAGSHPAEADSVPALPAAEVQTPVEKQNNVKESAAEDSPKPIEPAANNG